MRRKGDGIKELIKRKDKGNKNLTNTTTCFSSNIFVKHATTFRLK